MGKTMGKECMARLSRRLWGGTSLKTAAKEATISGDRAPIAQLVEHRVVMREVVSSTPAGPTLRVLK